MLKEFLSVFAENVLLAFAPVLASLVVAWVLAKAKAAWADFKAKQAGYASIIEQIARVAVLAAEQLNIAGLIKDKKEYAIATATAWLEAQGFKIDLAAIEAAIEAAVFEEFTQPELQFQQELKLQKAK